MASIDLLPDEILVLIFQWIKGFDLCMGAAQVCRRWSLLCRRCTLLLGHKSCLSRLKYCPLSLIVARRPLDSTVFFRNLESAASRLREFTAHSVSPLNNEQFASLICLRHLRHLDVFLVSRVFHESMLPVVRQLNSLVINETLRKSFLTSLADNNHLYALNMYGRSINYPPQDLRIFLRASNTSLTELTLRCNNLSDEMYKVISSCKNLRTLQLYMCWLMTKFGALVIMKLPKLRILHLTGARVLRETALNTMITELPKTITELVLSGSCFANEHITALSKQLPDLLVLELWKCYATSDGFVTLISSLKSLKVFDTDVLFEIHQRNSLSTHPTLETVRCFMNREYANAECDRVKFLHANARYKYFVIRGDGDGYCDDLYYYWNQRVLLETKPHRQ